MYTNINVYTYMCIHKYICICICTCIYIFVFVCMYIVIDTYTRYSLHKCVHVETYTYIYRPSARLCARTPSTCDNHHQIYQNRQHHSRGRQDTWCGPPHRRRTRLGSLLYQQRMSSPCSEMGWQQHSRRVERTERPVVSTCPASHRSKNLPGDNRWIFLIWMRQALWRCCRSK